MSGPHCTRSLVTTVATPSKWFGPVRAAQIFGQVADAHLRAEAVRIHLRGVGGEDEVRTGALRAWQDRPPRREGSGESPRAGRTGAGLTKIEATTRSALLLASATRERWPSCSAPMVGTSAILSRACRGRARRCRNSFTVRTDGDAHLCRLSKQAWPHVNCRRLGFTGVKGARDEAEGMEESGGCRHCSQPEEGPSILRSCRLWSCDENGRAESPREARTRRGRAGALDEGRDRCLPQGRAQPEADGLGPWAA